MPHWSTMQGAHRTAHHTKESTLTIAENTPSANCHTAEAHSDMSHILVLIKLHRPLKNTHKQFMKNLFALYSWSCFKSASNWGSQRFRTSCTVTLTISRSPGCLPSETGLPLYHPSEWICVTLSHSWEQEQPRSKSCSQQGQQLSWPS